MASLVESADISTWTSDNSANSSEDEAMKAMNELDLQEQRRNTVLVPTEVQNGSTKATNKKHKKHKTKSSHSSSSPRSSSKSSKSSLKSHQSSNNSSPSVSTNSQHNKEISKPKKSTNSGELQNVHNLTSGETQSPSHSSQTAVSPSYSNSIIKSPSQVQPIRQETPKNQNERNFSTPTTQNSLLSPSPNFQTLLSSTSSTMNSSSFLNNVFRTPSSGSTINIQSPFISKNNVDEVEVEIPTRIFVNPPKGSLVCPIHGDIMLDPVIAINCGHSFCRNCILNSNSDSSSSSSSSTPNLSPPSISPSSPPITTATSSSSSSPGNGAIPYVSNGKANASIGRVCPLDGQPMGESLIPNRALAAHIDEQLVYCQFGLKKKNNRWVLDREGCSSQIALGQIDQHERECGYAFVSCPFCSDQMRRKILDDHLINCNRQMCPNCSFGCSFVGQRDIISRHMQECIFEKLKHFISFNQQQISSLQIMANQHQEENRVLHQKVNELTLRVEKILITIDTKIDKIGIVSPSVQPHIPISHSNPPGKSLANTAGKLSALRALKGHNGPVWALAISNDILVSGSSDSSIRVWYVNDTNMQGPVFVAEGIIHAVGINIRLGRKHIISGSSEKFIRVWDLDTGKCVKTITQHENTVCSIVVGSGYVFTGSFGEIKVWNPETYEEVKTLRGHNHWVRAIAIHNRTLYGGSYNCIKIWDLNTFDCTGTIQMEFGSIYSIAIAENRLLVGTFQNLIYVVDFDSKENYSLHGHQGAVYSLCVCGDKFFSGSYDTTIRMWNLSTLRCIETIGKHNSSVEALVQSGEYLFSGSTDGTIKIWGYP